MTLGLAQRLLPFFVVVQGYTVCEWGLYGEHCNLTCPQNCALLPPRDVPYCDTDTGKCSEGCQRGWHGDLCNQDCSRNCLGQTCNHQTGHCTHGCSGTNAGQFCNDTRDCGRGWYGDLCQHPCSINCLEERCNHTTGACILGCSGTYTGEFCNTAKVVNNKEDANSLDAVLDPVSLRLAVAVTVILTVTVIVILRFLVIICNKPQREKLSLLRPENKRGYYKNGRLVIEDMQATTLEGDEHQLSAPVADHDSSGTSSTVYQKRVLPSRSKVMQKQLTLQEIKKI